MDQQDSLRHMARPSARCNRHREHAAAVRAEAKDLKRKINAEWIYPPVGDAATILHHAGHRTTWPTAEVAQAGQAEAG